MNKLEKFLQEAKEFSKKNITASDSDFIAWNNSLIRFEVNNSDESEEDFKKRINKLMREDNEDKGNGSSGSERWTLGKNNRCLGSIHSDIWEGTAADLSQANYIAVYPISGWWKEKNKLEKYNNKIRYSLIISLETPNQEIDLYTPIITQIKSKIPIEVQIKK